MSEFLKPDFRFILGGSFFLGIVSARNTFAASAQVLQEFEASEHRAASALGSFLDAAIVRDDGELFGSRAVVDEGFDQIVGLFLMNGEADGNSRIILML